MKKFSYRMQNILNLKVKIEEQEKNNYSIAKHKLNEEEEKLSVFERRKASYEQDLREVMSSRLNVIQLRRYEEAIEIMKDRIKTQKQVVRKAEQAVDLAMQKLNIAMMERKTYEKLREVALEEYKKEFNEEEKKEIDELVSFKYSMKET